MREKEKGLLDRSGVLFACQLADLLLNDSNSKSLSLALSIFVLAVPLKASNGCSTWLCMCVCVCARARARTCKMWFTTCQNLSYRI